MASTKQLMGTVFQYLST